MTTLQEVFKMVDTLSAEERVQLRLYLDHFEKELSPEERIQRLTNAAKEIRKGFTDEEWDEVEQAMNEKYVEEWDESEWTD